jgi:hypothetical protein
VRFQVLFAAGGRCSSQAGEVEDAVAFCLLAALALPPLLALLLRLVILTAFLHVLIAVLVFITLVLAFAICGSFSLFLVLVILLDVLPGFLAPYVQLLSTAADHPARDVESKSDDAFLAQLVMLELVDDLVRPELDEAQRAVAQAHSGNFSTRSNTVRKQGDDIQALAASLGAIDGDALVLVVPHAALPQCQNAIAAAHQHLLADAGALLRQARDHDGAEQLLLLVLAAHHDASAQVGDSQSAASGSDPLLAEAAGARLGGWQRREGGDVVVVWAVRGLWLERRLGALIPDVVDVQRGRVCAENERLGREGVDEGGRIDAAVRSAHSQQMCCILEAIAVRLTDPAARRTWP